MPHAYLPLGTGTAREAGATGRHAQVQQLLLTRPLSAQLGGCVHVTAVHEDLAQWAGGGWRRRGGCWQGLGCPAGCLKHGPWGGILGARGGQGDLGTRQLEDAGREGAVLLSGPCLGSQMHIIEGGGAVGCQTRQTPPLPAPRVPCSLHQRLFQALHMHFLTESCNNSGRYYHLPFPI